VLRNPLVFAARELPEPAGDVLGRAPALVRAEMKERHLCLFGSARDLELRFPHLRKRRHRFPAVRQLEDQPFDLHVFSADLKRKRDREQQEKSRISADGCFHMKEGRLQKIPRLVSFR
jgi:hypothetical protein